jgi:pyridoxamine-phosphate oxidase
LGNLDLAALRVNYQGEPFREENAGDDPIRLFQHWLQEAIQAKIPEPNAMALATANQVGKPSVRIVLLKNANQEGFTFFTSYVGRKASEMKVRPEVSACFYWELLHRQVRIEGTVVQTSREISEQYFHSRPRESQIAAWCAPQSSVLSSRDALEKSYAQHEKQFAGAEVPLPTFWGGYLIRPDSIEFWQGRPNRLHDRLRFDRVDSSKWNRVRLAP